MSTNYTNNYNLCQWEASDKVLRTDFNADNAKIDAALAQLNRYTASVEQKTDTLANSAYTIQNPQIVAGHYTGTGTEKQSIQLGFRPRMVLVLHQALKMDSNAYWRWTGCSPPPCPSPALALRSTKSTRAVLCGDVPTRTAPDSPISPLSKPGEIGEPPDPSKGPGVLSLTRTFL